MCYEHGSTIFLASNYKFGDSYRILNSQSDKQTTVQLPRKYFPSVQNKIIRKVQSANIKMINN